MFQDFLTWIVLGIWSQHNWESCSKYSNVASCKTWEIFKQWKASILNLQVCASLRKIWIIDKLRGARLSAVVSEPPEHRPRAWRQTVAATATLTVVYHLMPL
jgi:hypothetical protein